MLAEFRREHEHVEIRLAEGNREKLVRLLQANEVDIAVMGRPPRELATRAEPFAAHPHVFVAAASHPLATREAQVDVESLRPQAFIVREEGSGTRAAMEQFFADARLQPRVAMEMSSNETIKQAVIAGFGLGFLSSHAIAMELATGALAVLDVVGFPAMRHWYVVHHRQKRLPPVASAFKAFLRSDGARLIESYTGAGPAAR
jgi:DNA-binding transcriptional LysR family regulator